MASIARFLFLVLLSILCRSIATNGIRKDALVNVHGGRVLRNALNTNNRNAETKRSARNTLLVYIFSDTDPMYIDNFDFFVNNGLSRHVDYVFVIQENPDMSNSTRARLTSVLEKVPPQSIVLTHKNECYDTGTFGWALSHSLVSPLLSSYKYFLMLNSSVRGPFLQPFFPKRHDWHRFLTNLFGGPTNVHLAGASISCEGMFSPRRNAKRQSPHVQSWLLALDKPGLDLVMKDGHSFACHKNREDAIWHGELGTSDLMLRNGYNIACLLGPYQGVDWRLEQHRFCNHQINPMMGHSFYGTVLSPFATVFTKYKHIQTVLERSASMYEAYMLTTRMYEGNRAQF